jgi:hypothetical protein
MARPISDPSVASANDLRQVDGEDFAAGGAEGFEGRDDIAALVEMALDGVGDADTTDQQRSEADEREELREARDVAFKLRRGVAAGADFPARFGSVFCAASTTACVARR